MEPMGYLALLPSGCAQQLPRSIWSCPCSMQCVSHVPGWQRHAVMPSVCAHRQEEDLVGPAVPPPEGNADEAGDAWDDRGLGEPDEEADPYRLPITSEVALEGAASSASIPSSPF